MTQRKKGSISRKDALKRLGGLALGVPLSFPLTSWALGGHSFLKSDLWAVKNFKEFPPLFPFQISHHSPVNVSNVKHFLDAPAGKHGFIRVENGRFVHNAGPVRLNGTNLTGPANFPSQNQANRLADRLARFGLNCVRLHYMDANYGNFRQKEEPGIIANDPNTQRNFNSSQLDKLDYLISALKSRGIYVDINLHVARWWDDRDGFPYQNQTPIFDKGLDNFYPRMISLQKEYATKLLTHVNPYTGKAYTEEPCVAMIEINNENSIFKEYFGGAIDKLPDPYATEFRNQWNLWLENKYKSTDKLKKSWKASSLNINGTSDNKKVQTLLNKTNRIENKTIPTVRADSIVPLEAKKDFFQFIIDTEHIYWSGMYNFLKKDLKVKHLVSGTQLGYGTPFNLAKLDYLDNHAYWHHPSPVSPDWRIINEPMVNTMGPIQWFAAQRVLGNPYNVSEFNAPFPNQYGAEAEPILRACGRFQGWDGVFEYTYNDRSDFDPTFNEYFFPIIERTDVLAHLPACAAFFLRGDVQEGKSTVVGNLDYAKYFDHLVTHNQVVGNIETIGLSIEQTMLHKTAVDLTGKSKMKLEDIPKTQGQKIFVSDTGELTWNIEQPEAGYFKVDTPNSKLFTGFPQGRTINLSGTTISIGKTRLGWATISMVSTKASGFGESDRSANILVAATGISQNKDMVMEVGSGNKITLSKWGGRPVYAEGIPATIILPASANRTKCFALDTLGNRMKRVTVLKNSDGHAKILIDPSYKTVWYEIEIS